MLFEAPPYYLIDGVSVMRDHADPLQYYYLPLAPQFVTSPDGGVEVPQFLLIKYRSATRSGGFADFDVHLGLSKDRLATVTRELQRLAGLPQPPRLTALPVVDGSVKLMLLGQQSGGGSPAGGSPFVRSIHHGAKPSLYGDNRAAFSAELDEQGVTILDQAMRGELSPIGVVYALDYLALRPAYHVRLHIDWDRVQEILDSSFGHESLFTDVQIRDVTEKLQEERAIRFEVDELVPEDEGGTVHERLEAAVARVRDMIKDAFFESSIDPLHEPPDGWDKARDIVKSFAPQRFSPLGVFSYKKTHYSRVDRKRLDVDFSERITLKRSIYPQGHLAGLFRSLGQGLSLDRLVIPVDADDPWFQRRKVKVISRADFEHDPVRSMTATLTYGGATRTALLHKDAAEAEVEWPSVVVGGGMVEPVDFRYTVELEPADGGERPGRLSSETAQVLGTSREIQPRDLFSLEAIPILTLPGFPWDRYPRVDVQLRYDDPDHQIRQDDLVRLDKEHPNAEWRRFLIGPPAAPVMVKLTYHAADHRDRELPLMPLTRPQVDVADPFPGRLKVKVVSLLDFNQVSRAFVDLVYDDPANSLRVEDSVELSSGQTEGLFVVDRADPTLSQVRYRITLLMQDGTAFEGPWSTTLNSRILVRADIRGHRAVTLRSPADFAASGLERIKVEARMHDELAGISVADEFSFTAPGATATFEFDFVDPARDFFELRIGRLFSNGLSSQQDWQRFDQDSVTVPATT